jgi:alanyl-tRNA synthetase
MPYAPAMPGGKQPPAYVPKEKRRRWSEIWNSVFMRERRDGASMADAEEAAFQAANAILD